MVSSLRSGATPHKPANSASIAPEDDFTPQRRGRGRPRKSLASPGDSSHDESVAVKTPRLKKRDTDDFETPSVVSESGKRGRGRPPRKSLAHKEDDGASTVVSEPGTAAKRGRGRPSLAASKGIDEMLMSPNPGRNTRSIAPLKFEESDEDEKKPIRSLRSAGNADLQPLPPTSRPSKTPKTPKSPKIKKESPRSPKNLSDFPDMISDMSDAPQPEEGTIVVTRSNDGPARRTIRREFFIFPIVLVLILATSAYYGVLDIVVKNAVGEWHKLKLKAEGFTAKPITNSAADSAVEFEPLPQN